jgi:transposase
MKKSISARREMKIDWKEVAAVGLDLGDRVSQLVCVNASGERIGEGRVPTTAAAMEKQFGTVEPTLIAIETGTHSPWVSRLLARLGHHVTVANSRKLRLIYENHRKNDRVDAEYLARLVRLDRKLLCPVEHRNERAQQHVALIRARDQAVETRTRLINHVRGAVKSMGTRLPSCSAGPFVKRAAAAMPAELKPALEPLLTLITAINEQITKYDRNVERLIDDEYREVQVLTQITGVGSLTAVAFAVTIGDRKRFAQSRTVGAWVGLTPGQRASGKQDPQQRITKEGDSYLRRLLVNCSQYILGRFGPDCDLRRHGLAIAARGGKNAKKRAVVAVARKLAVLMHRLWCTQAIYEPLRKGTTSIAA